MLGPPDTLRHTEVAVLESILVLNIPRVIKRQSAWGTSGLIDEEKVFSPVVGPWKYPWSTASMTVLPVFGFMMRESLFLIPKSIGLFLPVLDNIA